MPEYLSPGVYIEEVSSGSRPIEGVSTSTTGFAGRTERGPVQPRLTTSWSDYYRWYGGYLDQTVSYLPFAVKGFFDNGGQRLFIARVIGAGSQLASINLPAAGGQQVTLEAIGQGAWGNNLLVRVVNPASRAAAALGFFRLTLLYYAGGIPRPFLDPTDTANFGDPLLVPPDATEDYESLSPDSADANYFRTAINSRSQLIRIPDGTPDVRPNNIGFPANFLDFATADADTLFRVFSRALGAGVDVTVAIAAGNANTVTIAVVSTETYTDVTVPNLLGAINSASTLVTASWHAIVPGNPIVPSLPNVAAVAVGDQLDQPTADPNTDLRLTSLASSASRVVHADFAAGGPANTITVTLTDTETFSNIPVGALLSTINSGSDLVRAEWHLANPGRTITPSLPSVVGATALPNGSGQLFAGGLDGTFAEAQYIGDGSQPPSQRSGLAALRGIDEISILAAPDEVRFAAGQLTDAIVDQCEQLKDRFGVLTIADRNGDVSVVRPPRDTSYAAVYYPFIRIMDPRTQTDILIPPTGHVAGIYARVDVERGVHKAPANEVVRGILTVDLSADRKPLEFTLGKGEQDILNPRGVNVIRDFRAQLRDIRVWGGRTGSSDGQWRYVNVRRLFIFIEQSIERGTQWVVFEPNDDPTWSAVRRSITGFLTTVWRSGALMGTTADEAFFVKCDATTMTQDDIDNGRLICLIGIAPVKPAEFVIFRISQKTMDSNA